MEENRLIPEEAVIDKDLASALLSEQIKADRFIILTDVPYVYLDYGTPDQRELEVLDIEEIDRYMKEGKFSEGNMAPKIRAAKKFIQNGGSEVIITNQEGLKQKKGTRIVSRKN